MNFLASHEEDMDWQKSQVYCEKCNKASQQNTLLKHIVKSKNQSTTKVKCAILIKTIISEHVNAFRIGT